jgi:hypothetical protein
MSGPTSSINADVDSVETFPASPFMITIALPKKCIHSRRGGTLCGVACGLLLRFASLNSVVAFLVSSASIAAPLIGTRATPSHPGEVAGTAGPPDRARVKGAGQEDRTMGRGQGDRMSKVWID